MTNIDELYASVSSWYFLIKLRICVGILSRSCPEWIRTLCLSVEVWFRINSLTLRLNAPTTTELSRNFGRQTYINLDQLSDVVWWHCLCQCNVVVLDIYANSKSGLLDIFVNKTFRILTLSYITETGNWIFGNLVMYSVLFSVSWLAFCLGVLAKNFGNFWLSDNTRNEQINQTVMQGTINLCLLILLIASIIGEINGVEMDAFFPPFRQFFSRSTFISRRSWIREFRLHRKSLSNSELAGELSEWTNRRKHRTGSSFDHISQL